MKLVEEGRKSDSLNIYIVSFIVFKSCNCHSEFIQKLEILLLENEMSQFDNCFIRFR